MSTRSFCIFVAICSSYSRCSDGFSIGNSVAEYGELLGLYSGVA